MKTEHQTQIGAEKRRQKPRLSQGSPRGWFWYSPPDLWHCMTREPPIAEHSRGEVWRNRSPKGVLPDLGSLATGRVSNLMQPVSIPLDRGMVANSPMDILIEPCRFCTVEEWKFKRQKANTLTIPYENE
jgi:hypothetical protein